MVLRFFTHAVEVVEDAKSLYGIQFLAVGVHVIETGDSIIDCAVEEGAGFLNVLLVDRQGDVALLYNAVRGVCHLIEQHGVVFCTEAVQIVSLGRDEDILLEVLAVDPLVIDGDLGAFNSSE